MPEFPTGNVPISVVAKAMRKDASYVRAGIITGYLPIGMAMRHGEPVTSIKDMDGKKGRISYYVSPKKLYEETGFLWDGKK